MPARYQDTARKGLSWLASQQHKDGHWEGHEGQYPVALTGLAGMAFLTEGSTPREGKYADNLRRSVGWVLAQSQEDGLIGAPKHPHAGGRYMFGHAYALLFLAGVYGEEEDRKRREKLEDVLRRAVAFSAKAQASNGGWGYVMARESGDFAEGAATCANLHGLLAVRHAGIPVPKNVIAKAFDYLQKSTNPAGGVGYMPGHSEGRPPITAAALVCGLEHGPTNRQFVASWARFVHQTVPLGQFPLGYDEYLHFYLARAAHTLADIGYGRLCPESKEKDRLTWIRYREKMFPVLVARQAKDGAWRTGYIGPVYATAVYLTVLQLDNVGNGPRDR